MQTTILKPKIKSRIHAATSDPSLDGLRLLQGIWSKKPRWRKDLIRVRRRIWGAARSQEPL